jgi:hypothetical protein
VTTTKPDMLIYYFARQCSKIKILLSGKFRTQKFINSLIWTDGEEERCEPCLKNNNN